MDDTTLRILVGAAMAATLLLAARPHLLRERTVICRCPRCQGPYCIPVSLFGARGVRGDCVRCGVRIRFRSDGTGEIDGQLS